MRHIKKPKFLIVFLIIMYNWYTFIIGYGLCQKNRESIFTGYVLYRSFLKRSSKEQCVKENIIKLQVKRSSKYNTLINSNNFVCFWLLNAFIIETKSTRSIQEDPCGKFELLPYYMLRWIKMKKNKNSTNAFQRRQWIKWNFIQNL